MRRRFPGFTMGGGIVLGTNSVNGHLGTVGGQKATNDFSHVLFGGSSERPAGCGRGCKAVASDPTCAPPPRHLGSRRCLTLAVEGLFESCLRSPPPPSQHRRARKWSGVGRLCRELTFRRGRLRPKIRSRLSDSIARAEQDADHDYYFCFFPFLNLPGTVITMLAPGSIPVMSKFPNPPNPPRSGLMAPNGPQWMILRGGF